MADIFVVEDEEALIDIYRGVFESIGYRMAGWAMTGEEAVARLATMSKRPDLIIMDNRLPGISGLETTVRILRSDPACRILFVTADEGARQPALKCGAVDFILKPFHLDELISILKRHCAGAGNAIAPQPLPDHVEVASSPITGHGNGGALEMSYSMFHLPTKEGARTTIRVAIAIGARSPGGQLLSTVQSTITISGLDEGPFKERIVRHLFLDDRRRIQKFSIGNGGSKLVIEGITYPGAEKIKREVELILAEEGGEISAGCRM